MRETSYFKTDALAETGELLIPLVFIKNICKTGNTNYIGFIPGFLMKNISAETLQECKSSLKDFLMNKLKQLKKSGEPFPFFPNKEQILKSYENVDSVEFIKIKSNSRKNKNNI